MFPEPGRDLPSRTEIGNRQQPNSVRPGPAIILLPGFARYPKLNCVSNELFVDLDGVDHNAVSDCDIRFLYWLPGSGERCLRVEPDFLDLPGGRFDSNRTIRYRRDRSGYLFFAAVSKQACCRQ